MALYNGKPVMIGAYEHTYLDNLNDTSLWRSNASYFEIFDPESEDWSDLKRNPFFPEATRRYLEGTSVTKENSFLVFGGELVVYDDKGSKLNNFNNHYSLTLILIPFHFHGRQLTKFIFQSSRILTLTWIVTAITVIPTGKAFCLFWNIKMTDGRI